MESFETLQAQSRLNELLTDQVTYDSTDKSIIRNLFTHLVVANNALNGIYITLLSQQQQQANSLHLPFRAATLMFDFATVYLELRQRKLPEECVRLKPRIATLIAKLAETRDLDLQLYFAQSYLFLLRHYEIWLALERLYLDASLPGDDDMLNDVLSALPRQLEIPDSLRMFACMEDTPRLRIIKALSFTNWSRTTARIGHHEPCDLPNDYVDMMIRVQGAVRGLFVGFGFKQSSCTYVPKDVLFAPGMHFVWDKQTFMPNIKLGPNFHFNAQDNEFIEHQYSDDNSSYSKVFYRVYTIASVTRVRKQLF